MLRALVLTAAFAACHLLVINTSVTAVPEAMDGAADIIIAFAGDVNGYLEECG